MTLSPWQSSFTSFCKHWEGWHPRTMKLEIFVLFHRYEDYVDQHYKEFLKNQGKVDSVRLEELGGGERIIVM